MEQQEKIYCGSGRTKTGTYGEFYTISVCLSDLPKEHITEARNGKKYINLTVNKKRETDQYGKDLSVMVDTWKPDPQKAHAPKQEYAVSNSDDLPF